MSYTLIIKREREGQTEREVYRGREGAGGVRERGGQNERRGCHCVGEGNRVTMTDGEYR